MARPVRARPLTSDELDQLLRLLSEDEPRLIRKRAVIIMASTLEKPVPAIAQLVTAHPDTVRRVIHAFNRSGLAALAPKWAGGRPRQFTAEDETFIVETARNRPEALRLNFDLWSLRKLSKYLATNPTRQVHIGRERLRQVLREHRISFQSTRAR